MGKIIYQYCIVLIVQKLPGCLVLTVRLTTHNAIRQTFKIAVVLTDILTDSAIVPNVSHLTKMSHVLLNIS